MNPSADSSLTALLAQMSWARALARDLVRDWDRADELVQEVWLKALENPPRRADSVRGWISRVMRNRIYEDHRNATRRRELLAPAAPVESETPAETLERLETVQLLGQVVRQLPEPFKAAILLYYFEGCKIPEVARRLGIRKDAAEKRVRRGRELIEAQLRAREDAKRWAHGLLVLAAPKLVPATSAALAVSAALLLVCLLLVQSSGALGWIPGVKPAQQASASSGPELHAGSEASPEPARMALGSEHLERVTVPVVREVRVIARDTESLSAVGGLDVLARFRAAGGEILGSARWQTDPKHPYGLELPEHVTTFEWEIVPHADFTDGGGTRLHTIDPSQLHQPISIPVWRLSGRLEGRVLDTAGQPVPDATVELWFGGSEQRNDPPALSLPVDADGAFTVAAAFPIGMQTFVAARAPGHAALRCLTVAARSEAHAAVTGVELALEPGASHRVLVFGPDGKPVLGARVALRPALGAARAPAVPEGRLTGRRSYRLLTGPDGACASVLLGRDEWQLEVAAPGLAPWRGILDPAGATTRVVLAEAAHLHGQVMTADRRPAPGVRVIAEGVGGVSETRSDAAGHFVLARPGWPAEPVRLVLLPEDPQWAMSITPEFVPELDGFQRSEVLRLGEMLSVTLAQPDGSPWEQSPVEYRISGGPRGSLPGTDRAESWLETRERYQPGRGWLGAAAASFALAGLDPAPLRVSFWSDHGLLAEQELLPSAAAVQIRAGSYSDARASLRGVARDPSGEVLTLASLRVQCQRLDSRDPLSARGAPIELDVPCVQGGFEVLGLQPGHWNVQVYAWDGSSVWHADALELRAGERRELAAVLEPAHAGVLRVLHADGQPAARARVRLLREDGSHQPIAPGLLASATDDEGRLALLRLPRDVRLRIAVQTRDGVERIFPGTVLEPEPAPWLLTLPD